MRYGYFDDEAREYVITRPDTPKSWSNYLGSRLYGGLITQNAGGYSFYKSGGTGRILRMRFNGVPIDEPGRFIYLRDDATGDYWSASWQPVGKPLDTEHEGAPDPAKYRGKVRHGLGYSVFESQYAGIDTKFTAFVPKGQAFEHWVVEITNPGTEPRTISAFSYAELANEWHYRQDLENLQYSQYVVVGRYKDNFIHRLNSNRDFSSENWFALSGADVTSYDIDRDVFLGPYRTQSAPLAVENGECFNSEVTGDNACASLHTRLELAPGETRQIVFTLGIGNPDKPWNHPANEAHEELRPGRELVAEYTKPERLEAELQAIKDEWRDALAPLQVNTPDPELNSMVNVWHAYQTHMTFNWSRGVSFTEAGDRDGLGYRDTAQDILSIVHSIPEAAEERLSMLLTGLTNSGGAMPLVKPLTHNPGHEPTPDISEMRSDDALWLPISVSALIDETGDASYLNKVLPFSDHGEGTVLEHLEHALKFSLKYRGQNGLVMGLAADWNDCIQFGLEGESMFTTFLLANALKLYAELAEKVDQGDKASWAREQLEVVVEAAEKAWDGDWYVRGISAVGAPLGSHKAEEGKIYLESNVWAAIAGVGDKDRAVRAMDSVHEHLFSEHGVALCDPPHTKPVEGIGLSLLVFPVGHKENGGIFCHANSWTIVAEGLLGRGNRAYEYYRSYLPAKYNDSAEIHQVEPYVYCQFTHGPTSPRFGQARNSWLTGTASWSYVGVTQYLLGVRPSTEGLEISPAIPSEWDGYSLRRLIRGAWVDINVTNPDHVESGVKSITVNGTPVSGKVVPNDLLSDGAKIEVVLG